MPTGAADPDGREAAEGDAFTEPAASAEGDDTEVPAETDDIQGADVQDDDIDADPLPGAPATPRNRAKSAVLWGFVGGFSFLVLAQGYLLLDGSLPFAYAWLFVVAAGVAVGSAGVTYGAEHRVAKRRT